MFEVVTDKGSKRFKTTEDAAEWLLELRPETASINGVDVTDECDWDAYGLTLGALDYAVEFGSEDN